MRFGYSVTLSGADHMAVDLDAKKGPLGTREAPYAFFALFPLIILFVTLASIFVDRDRAGTQIITFVETYVPIGDEKQSYIFDTIASVISARAPASAVAFVMLAWAVSPH